MNLPEKLRNLGIKPKPNKRGIQPALTPYEKNVNALADRIYSNIDISSLKDNPIVKTPPSDRMLRQLSILMAKATIKYAAKANHGDDNK